MPDGDRLKVYSLAQGGTQLVKLAQQMADNELRQSQNAVFGDLLNGGGLETRAGIEKVNTTSMAAALTGFCDVPLADLRNAGFDTAAVTLDTAAIDSLFASPVKIVPAPGPGLMALPFSMKVRVRRFGAVVWSAGPTMECRLEGDATTYNWVGSVNCDALTAAGATTDKFYMAVRAFTPQFTGSSNVRQDNRAVILALISDTNPGSPAQMDVQVLYHIVRGLY